MTRTSPYFVFVVVAVALGGVPKGFDEGGFSASITLQSFQTSFDLLPSQWKQDPSDLANRKANIDSFGVLGAAFGAYLALFCNDRLGRRQSYQAGVFIWASGILMQIFAGTYEFELFARIWGGLGTGVITVVAPLFLSEIAPVQRRGMIVALYNVVCLGMLTLGFFFNYVANQCMPSNVWQWRLMQAVPLFPMAFAFSCSFFLPETPRWLISKGRNAEALAVLARLRGSTADDLKLIAEFETMDDQVRIQLNELRDASPLKIMREMMSERSCRSRFFLSVAMQTIPQWTGGNGITYYITEIFAYAGVSSANTGLISSGAYGLVKLVFTIGFVLVFIDLLGRRRCFLAGLSLQLLAHLYMGIYTSNKSIMGNSNASHMAVASVFLYAVGWSIGMCTIPYIYCTEIFPTRMRSVSYAIGMGLHWFFQFSVVRVIPIMFVSLHVWGAYLFFAAVCLTGIIVFGLWAPETKGVPMERMGELFEGQWWTCWKAKGFDFNPNLVTRVERRSIDSESIDSRSPSICSRGYV